MLKVNINASINVKRTNLYTTFTVPASFPISENVRVEIAIASNKAPVAGIVPSSIQDVTVVSERFVNDRYQKASPCQPFNRTKTFLIQIETW